MGITLEQIKAVRDSFRDCTRDWPDERFMDMAGFLQYPQDKRIAELEAQVSDLKHELFDVDQDLKMGARDTRLDWQPITSESLPKVGDEVAAGTGCLDVHAVEGNYGIDWFEAYGNQAAPATREVVAILSTGS